MVRITWALLLLATLAAVVGADDNLDKNKRIWATGTIKAFSQPNKHGVDDPKQRVMFMDSEEYQKLIYDSTGFIGAGESKDQQWMIFFVEHDKTWTGMFSSALQDLAKHFGGDIRIAVVNTRLEEELTLAYEVYQSPRGYFIDKEGVAYAFTPVVPQLNRTVDWIENREFKHSPLRFKAPPLQNKAKLYWSYVKKEVRSWYKANLRDKIELYLRKVKFSYIVDMDPLDFKEINNLNTKTDRQLIFIFAGIWWVIESIWDLMAAPAKPVKPKSVIKRKKKSKAAEDEEPKEEDSPKEGKEGKEGKDKVE